MCDERTFKDGRVDGVQLVREKGQSEGKVGKCGQTFEIK